MIYIKIRLLDKLWSLISVTLAAQIGTLPLTLYYFHQFPVYFLPANMAIIPLVSLILYLSFVVVLFSMISGLLASVFGFLLGWSVQLVLIIVKSVEALPFSVIRAINPSFYQMAIFLLVGLLFFVYMKHRKIIYLQSVVGLLIGFFVLSGISSWNRLSGKEIVFFNVPGTRALILMRGRDAMVLYDRCDNAVDKLGYYMKPYWVEHQIRKVVMNQLSDSLRISDKDFCVVGHFVFFSGVRLYLQPSGGSIIHQSERHPSTDLVWLAASEADLSERFELPETSIVLYRGRLNAEDRGTGNPTQKYFKMNRAVRLAIGTGSTGSPNALVCSYYNESGK